MATHHTSSPDSPNRSGSDGLQKYSCVLCSSRKVKCDRHDPCSGCVKAQVTCIFRTPPPPRRGKRKSPEELQQARLKRYEEVRNASLTQVSNVRGASAAADEFSASQAKHTHISHPEAGRSPASPDTGKLVVEGVRSRYIESGLWKVLNEETSKDGFQGFTDETDDRSEAVSSVNSTSDDNGLVLGSPAISADLSSLHPQPVHMFKLWQVFLDNVHPVTQVIHAPTVQQQILGVSGNAENMSKPLEALMFAIYTLAVTSLEDADCDATFKESKSGLLGRYRKACRQALINAHFLRTSDLMVLQAYVMFLLSLRAQAEPETLWSLSGIAVRVAQRMGLHRDGTSLGLSPFEVEMRRRMWYQIMVLDGQTGQLTGSGTSLLFQYSDTKLPLNVNDSDLYPGMTHVPAEHSGPTQMSFSLLRYDICTYLQRIHSERPMAAERDRAIDEIEKRFDQNYIRNHDRSIPIHFLTMHVAALAVCRMRWLGANPHRWQSEENDESKSVDGSDMLFSTSLKFLDCELRLRANPAVQRFRWHSQTQAQWQTFVFVLSELRRRCDRREMDEDIPHAWSLIEQAIECRPDVITDHKKALHVAVCNVALAAWKSYEAALDHNQLKVPSFIQKLRDKMAAKNDDSRVRMDSTTANKKLSELIDHHPHDKMDKMDNPPPQNLNVDRVWKNTSQSIDPHSQQPTAPFDYMSMPLNPIDWAEWDDLLQNMDPEGLGIGSEFFLT